MKIRVTFKDPDTMQDAVDEAFKRLPAPVGVTDEEWDGLREGRADSARVAIVDGWMEYGEYITVEFDLAAKTATVVPR